MNTEEQQPMTDTAQVSDDQGSYTPQGSDYSGTSLDPTHNPQPDMVANHDLHHAVDLMHSLQHPTDAGGLVTAGQIGGQPQLPGPAGQVNPEAKPMTDQELLTFFQMKIQTSHHWYGSGKLAAQRVDADKYYRGEPRGDEQAGRSQVVSRDVAETVDSLMPSFMRIFASGDQVVVFNANTPGDEATAKQVTDYINHVVLEDNEGFKLIHTWVKDGLLKKNGIVKVVHEVRQKRTRTNYEHLTHQEWQTLQQDHDLQLENVRSYPDPNFPAPQPQMNPTTGQPMVDPRTGQPLPPPPAPMFYDCIATETKPEKKILIQNVAPDEFIIERRAVSLRLTGFLAQRSKRTISDLLECGYDATVINTITSGDDADYTQERLERFSDEDELPYGVDGETLDKSTRKVWVTEGYALVDYDGDGLAEWRKIVTAGNTGESGQVLLENVETDDHAFADLTPYPECHKFFGRSVYDQTRDIQDIKTALVRGTLDSIYFALAPRWGVVDGQVNLDDLLDVRAGGAVRMKNANSVVPLPTLMVAPQAQGVIEYIDSVKERRTGVTAYNQGLDADTLNKTATGVNLIQNAGQQRIELMARVFAEWGFRRLYELVYKLVCEYEDQKRTVNLRGKWVNIDPRDWKDRFHVSIAIGAGAINKDQQVQVASQMLQTQQAIVQAGGMGKLVTEQNIYNTLVKLVESVGWKTPDPYFTDPSTTPPPPPKPPTDAEVKAQKDIQQSNIDLQMKTMDKEMKAMDVEIKRLEAAIVLGKAAGQVVTDAGNMAVDGGPPFMPGADAPQSAAAPMGAPPPKPNQPAPQGPPQPPMMPPPGAAPQGPPPPPAMPTGP